MDQVGTGYRRKMLKIAKIQRLMGDKGCKWMTPDPSRADFSQIDAESIDVECTAAEWKDTVTRLREETLAQRKSTGNGQTQTNKIFSKRYIDQAEILTQEHLTKKTQGDTSEDACSVASTVVLELKLNSEQERAFHIVTQHMECPLPKQFKMFIGGMGGTGKTQVLRALIKYFDL